MRKLATRATARRALGLGRLAPPRRISTSGSSPAAANARRVSARCRVDWIGALKGWWVAGGFVHTGDKAQRTANPTLFLRSSTIYDMVVGRDWKMGEASWSGALSWKNIADTEYFNANQSRGQPGRVILSVSTKF